MNAETETDTIVDIRIEPPDGCRDCWVVAVRDYADPADPGVDVVCFDCASDADARQLAAAIALYCRGVWVR